MGAAITAAELLVGVELADRRRRKARQRYVEAILASVPVENNDLEVVPTPSCSLTCGAREARVVRMTCSSPRQRSLEVGWW